MQKEGRKKLARSYKQQSRATQHTQGSHMYIIFLVSRFRSKLSTEYGVGTKKKPVIYCGRGRPPKKALMNMHTDSQVWICNLQWNPFHPDTLVTRNINRVPSFTQYMYYL